MALIIPYHPVMSKNLKFETLNFPLEEGRF